MQRNAFESAQEVAAAYHDKRVAGRYAAKHEQSWLKRRRDRIEQETATRALSRVGAVRRILDCPAGTGRFHRLLGRFAPEVHAADASAEMLALGLARLGDPPPASAVVAYAQNLPFADGAFDLVYSSRLLHHFDRCDDRIAILRSFARVSRGPVVFSVFLTGNPASWRDARRARRRAGRPRRRHFTTLAAVDADLASAGLRRVFVAYKSRLFSPLAFIVAQPSERD